ncbi:hypothetical protein B0J14DRAFT_36698 [Halenospora varia]|nr:hypothetical protein B0J14DRAFT_36698 [Halenospora varia]
MVRLSSVLGATALLFSTTNAADTLASENFVSDDKSFTFSLNIPEDANNNALLFAMEGPAEASWFAIGMGNDKMENSLMFMAYTDPTGKNITLSPRLSYKEVEPSYTDSIKMEIFGPSGQIVNGMRQVYAKCSNCQSWKGGSINRTNTAQKFIWAIGPNGNLGTSDLTAGTKRHSTYGVFHMDMTGAVGGLGNDRVPRVASENDPNTKQVSSKNDHDFSAALHACIMILAFVGLMPIGVMILRVLNSPRWHGYNQALSLVVGIIGAGLGFYISTMYNRSKGFKSVHQIIGIIVTIMMIAQFVLGFLHHHMFKKTNAPTKLAPVHVWLGRVVIPLGIADGFLGFPLALNSKFNWVLLALVLAVVLVMGPFAFWRMRRNMMKAKTAHGVAAAGYQAEPWNTNSSDPSRSNINLTNYPPPPGGNRY